MTTAQDMRCMLKSGRLLKLGWATVSFDADTEQYVYSDPGVCLDFAPVQTMLIEGYYKRVPEHPVCLRWLEEPVESRFDNLSDLVVFLLFVSESARWL